MKAIFFMQDCKKGGLCNSEKSGMLA